MGLLSILNVKSRERTLGSFGERCAEKYLKRHGYKILERSYVAAAHEIDIIAENKEYIIFAEVKTRIAGRINPMESRPSAAVTPEKQRGIISAARCYIAYDRSGKKKRLDVIEVYAEEKDGKFRVSEIKHLPGAFNCNTAMTGKFYKT